MSDPLELAGTISDGATFNTRLYLADVNNSLLEDISDSFVSGNVSMNLGRANKLNLTLDLHNPPPMVAYRDYLAMFMDITFDDGRDPVSKQVGLYTFETPPGTYDRENEDLQILGEDLTRVIVDSVYDDTDNVPSGTVLRTELIATIAEAGITRVSIPPTTRTTGYNRSYPSGTVRLEKANLLISRMGFYDLFMDLNGRITTLRKKPIGETEPFMVVTDDVLLKPIEVRPTDPQGILNVIIATKDNPGEAPLEAIARNDSPTSRTSTVNTRVRARTFNFPEVEDQTELQALADGLLAQYRSYYQTARIVTFPYWPFGFHQTVDLALTGTWAHLNGRWWSYSWELGFSPSTFVLTQEIQRITDSATGEQI